MPYGHLRDQRFVPRIQYTQLTCPALGFGVIAVPFLVRRQNAPYGVEFPVLAQQVLAAQVLWMNVPDTHKIDIK